jgi:hypothetical protein
MIMAKLTGPQRVLLDDASRTNGAICAPDYPPLLKLLELKLVEARTGKYVHVYVIATDAGRVALATIPDERNTTTGGVSQ